MSWGYWDYPPCTGGEPLQMARAVAHGQRLRTLGEGPTDGLQSAFFNGVGYESWENVWGIWNQFTPRDAEALRRIATIERAVADMLVEHPMGAACPHDPAGRLRQPLSQP